VLDRPPAACVAADSAARYRVPPKPAAGLIDCTGRQNTVGTRLDGDVGGVREGDEPDKIAGRRAGDGIPGELLRALEPARRGQAERCVERDHGDAAGARRRAARKEWAREREREQHQRADAQREQQQFSNVPLLGVLHRRLFQQLDRRELDAGLGLALQQVQHDRQRRGGRTGQEQGGQEAHSARALVDR
jgi:hypothetical protein